MIYKIKIHDDFEYQLDGKVAYIYELAASGRQHSGQNEQLEKKKQFDNVERNSYRKESTARQRSRKLNVKKL